MRSSLRFALFALAVLSARAEALKDILARMDQAAAKFQSFTANTKRLDFTAVLNETTEMNGLVRLKKGKGGMQGIVEFDKPNQRTVQFAGKTMEVYYPKANTVEIYDAGKHASVIDEIILLGFGTSGAQLRKNYDVKLVGTETLNGIHTSRLELVPKSGEVHNYATKIELWIPEGESNPIQEKLTQPSKNYQLVLFSNLKVNVPLPASDFSLKLPPDVTRVYPQK
jgi:outer membrane lipoprotein-sorting protein